MQIRNSKDYVYGEELISARFVDTENLTEPLFASVGQFLVFSVSTNLAEGLGKNVFRTHDFYIFVIFCIFVI